MYGPTGGGGSYERGTPAFADASAVASEGQSQSTWRALVEAAEAPRRTAPPLIWCSLSLSLARSLASLFSLRAVTGESERGRGTTSR